MPLLLAPFLLALVLVACDDDEEPELVDDSPIPEDVAPPTPPAEREEPPTAGAAPEADAAPEPTFPEGPIYSVQLGAFQRSANASALVDRMEAEGLPTWTPSARVGQGDLTRVRVGATTSVADARRLVDRIRDHYEGPLWIAPVVEEEALPRDVPEATRRLLEGG